MNNFEHEYTHEIVCPYCGYKFADSWEFSDDLVDCASCDRQFKLYTDTTIVYTTERINCEETNEEHDYVLDEQIFINPYIYDGKNWTIYVCTKCKDEVILTSEIAEDGKPYKIPLIKESK